MFGRTSCILWLVVSDIGKQMILEGRFQSGQDFFDGFSLEFLEGQAPRRSGGHVAGRRGDEVAEQEAVRRPGG